MKYRTALVCGAGGFIGNYLVKRLKHEGIFVRGIDLKYPPFSTTYADEFIIGDLRDPYMVKYIIDQPFDEVYQLAADTGGSGYVLTGKNDATMMRNSAIINLNVLTEAQNKHVGNIFFSSSAFVYPDYNQIDPDNPITGEHNAYPAAPDTEFGWEKLFSERLYFGFKRNCGTNVHVARFHNIYGPEATWKGGKERAPAAICRKIAEARNGTYIEIWGDGNQTRSFLYIDECIEGIRRLMNSTFAGPVNIGSDEKIPISELAMMVIAIAQKDLLIINVPGPSGVRGRTSDNHLIKDKLGWAPSYPLRVGMEKLYRWVERQVLSECIDNEVAEEEHIPEFN